jgi:hypothetical protein
VLIVSQWLPTTSAYHDIMFRFIIQVSTGGIAYFVLLGLFWAMAGAPYESPEAQILRTIRAALERLVATLQFSRRPAG